jgi:hypothetical protein
VNNPDLALESYTNFLVNRFRDQFPSLEGSPVHIVYRKSVGTAKQEDKMKKKKSIGGKNLPTIHKVFKPKTRFTSQPRQPSTQPFRKQAATRSQSPKRDNKSKDRRPPPKRENNKSKDRRPPVRNERKGKQNYTRSGSKGKYSGQKQRHRE